MSVKIKYFVHGTTIDNEKKLASGQADVELSELGIEQTKNLGDLVKDNFDVVFTSDLKRAIDSSNYAFGDRFKVIQDIRIRECNYGDLTQKPKTWDNSEYIDKSYPKGESYKDVEKRIADFIKFLKENYKGKYVAIMAHEAPQLALEVLLKGKTWEQACEENWRKAKAWQPGWEYEIID